MPSVRSFAAAVGSGFLLAACGSGEETSRRRSEGAPSGGGAAATDGIVSRGGAGGTAGFDGEPAGDETGPAGTGGQGGGGMPVRPLTDPGAGPWQRVPPDQVLAVCGLDPAMLAEADRVLGAPWAAVRHGLLCHEHRAEGMAPGEAWSTTKTLGAAVAGVVAYQTRDLPRTGRKTGPFSDEDRVDHWLDAFSYNPNAHVAHVLAMVAHNSSLGWAEKPMAYDTVGTTQINTLSAMLTAAIAQDPGRFGANLEDFTQRHLFHPLGMTASMWSGGSPEKNFAFTWSTTVLDMARLGLLLLNGGVWSGQRLLSEEWVYRMTHPAFEDGNTGYGYLTWLNASSNHHFGGIPGAPFGLLQEPASPGPCAPVAVHRSFPHGLSEALDCNYAPPYSCFQEQDVGVWQAVGLGGQVIQGHPGLDLVLVGKDLTPLDSGPAAPARLWDAVLAAVVAGDPVYRGDVPAFCTSYGSNRHAPYGRR